MKTQLPLSTVFLDLETTGLDVRRDHILEVAVIGTGDDLRPLFEFSTLVDPGAEVLDDFQRTGGPAFDMAVASGLYQALQSDEQKMSLDGAEQAIINMIDGFGGAGQRVALDGSGVSHFDVLMIERVMPSLRARFPYYVGDVGVERRAYHRATGQHLSTANGGKTHRALDDVRCHLDEARAFRKMYRQHAKARRKAEAAR